MKLRWYVYALGSPGSHKHPTALLHSTGRHGKVLQEWVPGWGVEVIDGEHGCWVDIPEVWADSSPPSTKPKESASA